MRKSLIQITYLFVSLIMSSSVSAQNQDIENTVINSTEEYSANTITFGPDVTIGTLGDVLIKTNTLAVKPEFVLLAGGKMQVISGGVLVGLDNEENNSPDDYDLSQNFPNPFNPTTMINYQLPVNNDVNLSIFNMLGQRVATLVKEYQQAGMYNITFDGAGLSSGVYFYRISAGSYSKIRKMTLIK